ncbi:MAG: N-6 DNA methylase [Coriobacteriaceae bacterium]|nr:N-6 DNA methylase [Coriobacteriaceae bacterium]
MTTFISLGEASDYLGVSRNTLRNWDASGKLVADRNPINGYRRYDMRKISKLKTQINGLLPRQESDGNEGAGTAALNKDKEGSVRTVRSLINKLHSVIRDADASSDVMERFDETSKLLFIRLFEGRDSEVFSCASEDADVCANRIKRRYAELMDEHHIDSYGRCDSILLDDGCLLQCARLLHGVELGTNAADIKGLAYEEVVRGTFDKSDNQQFFTPPLIVNYMAAMLGDRLTGTICDPACGTSGFLIAASKINKDASFLGFEIDPRLAWVSQLNLCLHDVQHAQIELLLDGGTLGAGAMDYFSTIDVILTNPPFGSDYSDQDLLSRFAMGRGKKSRRRGILFIEQSWNLLKPGGVVAIIIDQGVLTSSSSKDVRDFIVDHFNILAITDLPDTAFMPYATVSTSILLLEKKAPGEEVREQKTFFSKARNVGRRPNGDDDYRYDEGGRAYVNNDLEGILEAWKKFQAGEPVSDFENVYVCDLTSEAFDNPDTRLDFAFHHPMRLHSIIDIKRCRFPLAELGEICTERTESYVPSADPDASTILLTGLANIESHNGRAVQVRTAAASIKSGVKRYEMNDLLFAKMRPALRKVAYMPFENGGYASNECAVFTVNRKSDGAYIVEPSLLAAILRSNFVYGQIVHLIQGSGRPRISNKNLRRIKVPIIPRQLQERYVAGLTAQAKVVEQMKRDAATLLREAAVLEEAAVNECMSDILGGYDD